MNVQDYLPKRVNEGTWVTAYTWHALREQDVAEFVLPIASLGTPYEQYVGLGDHLLPPLFHEAFDDDDNFKHAIVDRICECFPIFGGDNHRRIRVVELPDRTPTPSAPGNVIAFSVDTAVEEHGPHLPLGTDTIQSYAVLNAITSEFDSLELCHPVDYGQLTWGLPFGFSVDLTAELLTRYVANFVQAHVRWKQPSAVYVVDVHGSLVHRKAIVAGLKECQARWSFRWLHEPLAQFASQRGDQHAGGVETALIEHIDPSLLDSRWWPDRINELAKEQLEFSKAVELTPDLVEFSRYVRKRSRNGIVGDILNYHHLRASELFSLMTDVARSDVAALLAGTSMHQAGAELW
ncbi:MAG: creatininase family protein [Rubripirellula sp.]